VRNTAIRPVLILSTTLLPFLNFFQGKVDAVWASTAVITDEVNRLISASPNKTCQLDPVSIGWWKKGVNCWLHSSLCYAIGRSSPDASHPSLSKPLSDCCWRRAGWMLLTWTITDLCRTCHSCPSCWSGWCKVDYRSSLTAMSWCLASSPTYPQHHSTETVVLKVYNDLLLAAVSGLVSAVCLHDLTAAFDTVDHDLLLLRLERQFGLCGVTMLWFRSYLCGRSYRVWFAGAASRIVCVACSVPQGSVLGPRLFIMYSAIWPTRQKSMMSISMAMPMILSSMYTVDRRKLPQHQKNWNAVSQTWTIGCLRTGLDWTWTRQNYCGLEQDITCPRWTTPVPLSSSTTSLLMQVNMYVCKDVVCSPIFH